MGASPATIAGLSSISRASAGFLWTLRKPGRILPSVILFRAHDVNRVFFTYGRDIRLSPDQKSEPLNYFIYPYAEANGQPVKNLQTHFSFREISAARSTAVGR